MLIVLTTNIVLDIVFYVEFEQVLQTEGNKVAQERLVSDTSYIHTSVEFLFNIVLLSYLIS